jgi:hypothetical protein
MGYANHFLKLCWQGFCWTAGLVSLSATLAIALPFGSSDASAAIYHVVMPQTASHSVFLAANARIIDQAPVFARTHRYTIAADSAISPAKLYRAGAWLVLSATAPGCGPAPTS